MFDLCIKYFFFDKQNQKIYSYGVSQFKTDDLLDALLNLWNYKRDKNVCYIQIDAVYSKKTKAFIESNYIKRFNVAQRKKGL